MRDFWEPIKGPKSVSKKIVVFLLAFLILFSAAANEVKAQVLVTGGPVTTIETQSVPNTINNVKQTLASKLKALLAKAGSLAYTQVLRQTLNKIAYDAANYVGAAATGQKPLYVTMDWGKYWEQVGNDAVGSYIENFANDMNSASSCSSQLTSCQAKCQKNVQNPAPGADLTANLDSYGPCLTSCQTQSTTCNNKIGNATSSVSKSSTMQGSVSASVSAGGGSINVCSPSSLEAKIKIGLGLVQENQPQAPNCSATQMIQNWGKAGNDLTQKLTDYSNPNFLDNFKSYFDPTSNDLGIFMSARSDMASAGVSAKANSTAETTANKGWLDVRDISKSMQGMPDTGPNAVAQANNAKTENLGQQTDDILVSAANVFLNRLALSLFNNLMQNLAKKSGGTAANTPTGNTNDPNVIQYGEPAIQEATSKLLQPTFGVQSDYDVLSQLSVCPDPANPGPNNCVIDDQFVQAATEKMTVAEAISKGYLHGDWQLSAQTATNNYSLRNVSILRADRILPVGWEVAIQKATALNKKVTLNDLVACFDPNDSYNQFSSGFDARDQAWCQGLVDPNWVIKAPLNYCAREGAGYINAQPVVAPGVKGTAGAPDTLSSITVSRASDYCGDQKSCIKENSDGSCSDHGYCNEEKRIWSFGKDSCNSIYNTCQTFTNTASGSPVSYLQNTLTYAGCDSNNAGCRDYSWFGVYNTSTNSVAWDSSHNLYLNGKTAACDAGAEGCTSLIRVKPTWGANLVMDSNFANDDLGASTTDVKLNDWTLWSSGGDDTTRLASIVDATQEPGGASGKALKLSIAGSTAGQVVLGTYSDATHSLLPDNLQTIPGQSYTLSADIYLSSGSHAYLVLGSGAGELVATTTTLGSWQHLSVTRPVTDTYNQPDFNIHADSNVGDPIVVYVKNVKFEMSDWDTGYSPYDYSAITEKLLPPYLEKSCYVDATSATKDYRLKDNAPAVCSNFARRCNQDEVGCELYTAATDGFAAPAKVSSDDYCASECVGYDLYIGAANYFNSAQAENLMPTTATKCDASAVACNEFTNLDNVAQGGENKEYYSFLKQCIKPDPSSCANFYSWAGTSGGYQLVSSSLKKDAAGNPEQVAGGAVCDESIFNLPVSDPNYNADCQRFYNTNGQVSYRLVSHTVTCSDNCHTYRMTNTNIDPSINSAADCTTAQGHWDTSQNQCAVCLNGGVWDNNLAACTYQAIPGEGQTCDASQNGCREYNGPSGSDVRQAAVYDFESGSDGWYSNCLGGVSVSAISNDKDGHSLRYTGSASSCGNIGELNTNPVSRQPLIKQVLADNNVAAEVNVAGSVSQGSAYTLKFLARATTDTTLKIYFYNKDNPVGEQAVYFGSATGAVTVKGGDEWQIYQTNLDNLSAPVGANEVLVITADHDFYLDSVVMNQIADRYYLIKGSSVIPNSCYYDIFGNYQGADFNLGCSAYTDRASLQHNLRRFSQLCSSSAVGCEQMIDTKNYNPYGSGFWENGIATSSCDTVSDPNCTKVSGDSAIYAVYDATKLCNSADAGCSRLGQKQTTGAWVDLYLKNLPDSYNEILCNAAGVNCGEWDNGSGGLSYFKDPGDNACVYRASTDPTINGKNWYKLPVMRCDANANGKIDGTEKGTAICQSTADCNSKPCISDTNDYPCSVSYFQTIGTGGAGNQVPTPDESAGLCDATASGCTEYIDPVSSFMPNIVYNPDYMAASGTSLRDGWGSATGQKWNNSALNPNQQIISLTPNKLYSFSTISPSAANPSPASLEFMAAVKPLLSDNTLGTGTNLFTIGSGVDTHIIFDSLSNSQALVDGGLYGRTIEVKELAMDYQLAANVDKTSCNGVANFDKGCVLFNERTFGSSGFSALTSGWDANATGYNQAPVSCDSSKNGSCSANTLVKVSPDRVCAKWLDCITYVQDPVTQQKTCYAVGECNRLDDKGDCANFDNTPTTVRSFNPSSDKNSTGYSLIGDYYFDQMHEVGLNSDAHFDFEDSVPSLSCKRAIGTGACNFDKNIVADSLVREPDGAPTDYPAHGQSYLKVPSAYLISPQSANAKTTLVGDKDYYINLLINTKNSGVGSRVIIEFDNTSGGIIATSTFDDTANTGWTRKIYKFHTPTISSGASLGVKIYLGSNTPNQQGYVYFDDINIEPVLDTGKDASGQETYAARECRLYPTDDSLTCINKNNNVIADGWEGYCLEHDPSNPLNCLLWYPVDHIAPAQTNPPILGYSGIYPLNYCTELNGNFDLVEKREAYWVSGAAKVDFCGSNNNSGDSAGAITVCACTDPDRCNICSSDYVPIASSYMGDSVNYSDFWCVPRSSMSTTFQVGVRGNKSNQCAALSYSAPYGNYTVPPDPAYPTLVSTPPVAVTGLDSNAGACGDQSGLMASSNGWYKYDGLSAQEAKNSDIPIRVYDYSAAPADEAYLKLVAGSDSSLNYRLTCNQFAQTVDSAGLNYAWAGRVSADSLYPTSTPNFFLNSAHALYSSTSTNGLAAYGRNRETTPFGAATWPDNFDLLSSEPIPLKDQYSAKNNETALAGRPYGCRNDSGSGCSDVGYCSLNPNVFCLLTNTPSTAYNIAKLTCGDGGFGQCVPLWNTPLSFNNGTNSNDYESILKTIFLKSYSAFSYSYSNGAYSPSPYNYDDLNSVKTTMCANGIRPADSNYLSFCVIYPKVSNVVLKLNDLPVSGNNPYNLTTKGIYRLEFNTSVDIEQQPLREIRIDWGDGGPVQVVTGQDQHPASSTPHVFYHYYRQPQLTGISIRAYDNWGLFGVSTSSGNSTIINNQSID